MTESTGIGFSVADLPEPPPERVDEIIEDKFEPAENFAFVGAGQGGSKIVDAFYQLGYRRVLAINTTQQDLVDLSIPQDNKLLLRSSVEGAGKDPARGAEATQNNRDDIFDAMQRCFGQKVDRIFICIGAGGGTGTGAVDPLINICKEFAQFADIEDPVDLKIGVVCTLPKNSEGQKTSENAYHVFSQLLRHVNDKVISPLMVFDNAQLHKLMPKLPVKQYWPTVNRFMITPLHAFNIMAAQSSPYTTLDRADFRTLLESGCVIFGSSAVKDWSSETAISEALRRNFYSDLLSGGFDIGTSSIGGAIVVADPSIMEEVPLETLEYAFSTVTRMMERNSMLHQGIYESATKHLMVYSMLGDLNDPLERLATLKKFAGITTTTEG